MREQIPWRVRVLLRLAGFGGEMKTIIAVWAWLNGKKTAIGAVLQLVADVLTTIVPALPALGTVFGWESVTVLSITAKVAMALGLLHKALKWFSKRPVV